MRWEGPGPAAGTDPRTAAVVHGGVAVPAAGWRHYMIQPLVELYGGCMVVLKVS
jgi:hypothetical protein